MSDPITTTAVATVAKKAVLAVGVGGATVVTIASWEHLLHWWPVLIAIILFLVSIGKFLKKVENMDKTNTEQHAKIGSDVVHGLQRVEDKFETFSEKLNHRDSIIRNVERRVSSLENYHSSNGMNK